MTHVTLASSGTSCGYVPDKSRMTKAYLSINLDFRNTLLCALQRKLEWASAGLCLTKYTPLPLPPTRESDVDRFVVVPLGRIDCAVMGCFITIMAAHFPDERSEFACGYVGYDWRCSKTPGIDTISHATLEKCVSILSKFFNTSHF